MPRCAWILTTCLTALLHHTIGIPTAINLLLATATWTLTTPAALTAIAALATWHLLTAHTPHRRPRHAARA